MPACRRAPSDAELAPNGGRIDLGAFGGTADASLSTGARVVELGLIGGGSVLRGTVPIYWWTHGPWQSNDTVLAGVLQQRRRQLEHDPRRGGVAVRAMESSLGTPAR